MKSFFLFSLVISSALMFDQNDYFIEYERVELVSYNEKYLTNMKAVTFKYNRTHAAANSTFTIKKDLGNDAQVIVQCYTFLSNEYRTFPIHFLYVVCDAIAVNDFGLGDALNYGNFSGCPIKKGTYYINKWTPNSSKFPPYIPNGKYMAEIRLLHSSEEIAQVRGYATVSRPLGRRH